MRANGNKWSHKDVSVTLAQAYGYCWGVERAVQMAYEARKQFPSQKMHITNEIIHNPAVNQVHCFVQPLFLPSEVKEMTSPFESPLSVFGC